MRASKEDREDQFMQEIKNKDQKVVRDLEMANKCKQKHAFVKKGSSV